MHKTRKNVIKNTKIGLLRRDDMRGFVCIAQGCYINKDLIDKDKTYFDTQKDRYVLYDIYGNKYLVEHDVYKGKVNDH